MSRLFAIKGQDKDAPDSSHCFIANILTPFWKYRSKDENFHIAFKITVKNHNMQYGWEKKSKSYQKNQNV